MRNETREKEHPDPEGKSSNRIMMNFAARKSIALIGLMLLSLSACDGKTDSGSDSRTKDPVVDRSANGASLKLERRAAFDTTRQRLEMSELPQLDAVDKRLETLFQMIDRRDLTGLEKMVYPGEGVHVDLKAHRTVPELKKELSQPDGYFQKFYLDSQLLRQSTGDSSQVSLHELFNKNSRVQAEYYLEPGATQIEVRFYLGSTPEENFRVNNAVLIQREGEWYFLQLP
ncbi:MAG: hypothetical protein CMN76_05205 [Spirochaetaceae bacterium]|nr:hypothetical protein [Spirochaetaceae bacterium]|tara:strand:+ start:58545 stop:59231 length:687 start_codon:yes stop_codon:yes gene_type:complete